MPRSRVMPAAGQAASATPPDRDRAVDVARLAALVVVMFGHCALLLAKIDSGGLHVGNALGEIPPARPVTWILQVMPLFFLAGGAAGAYGWHPGKPWGAWLLTRAQRLYRPVFWYLAFWTVALLVTRAILGPASAERLGAECVALLWFLGVYLVVLGFVPALARLRSGRSYAVIVSGLLAATAVFDIVRHVTGVAESGVATFVLVWLIPIVIGVAYARRMLSARAALVISLCALMIQTILAVAGAYEVSLVVTGQDHFSNSSPPTLLLGLHCTWMSCAFVAVAKSVNRWATRPRVWHAVAVGNGGAMTLYLWHIPAIAIAAFGLHAVGMDAYDPNAPGFWWLLALRAVVFAVVMAVIFWLLSPLEHRRLPWWDAPVTARGVWSTVAGVLVCIAGVALVLLAKNGFSGVAGWTSLGGFVVASGLARVCASVAPSQR